MLRGNPNFLILLSGALERSFCGAQGFKRFDHAAVTISGIELAEQIQKGQFKTGKFRKRKATMSELWNAALAA
jgi:hypothetical protein